jgi:hypothetical protein
MKRLAYSFFVFLLLAMESRAGEKPAAARGSAFAFAFGKEPLVYSVHVKMESKGYASSGSSSYSYGSPYANGAQSAVTKSTGDLRYKIRLTGTGMTKDGLMVVKYEPFDYEAEADVTVAAGHFVTTMHDMSLKTTQNGIVIIDTDKGIGMGQAKTMKIDAILMLLSGEMDVNSIGEIKNVHGDLPFVDSRQEQMKTDIGLFGFVLPPLAITNGETWEVVTPIKKFGTARIDGAGINYTNIFTLAEDASSDNANIATFTYSAPLFARNLSGYIEEHGQSTHEDLSELEQHGFGTVHFDKKRHVFLDEQLTKSGSVVTTMLIEGRAMTSHAENRSEVEMKLIPASGEDPDSEKPRGNSSGGKTL